MSTVSFAVGSTLCLVSAVLQGLSAHHYNEELAVTDQLLQLVDPSRVAVGADQLAAAQEEHGNAAAEYMGAVRNMLQMSSSSLADIPGKAMFCRQRIAQVSNRLLKVSIHQAPALTVRLATAAMSLWLRCGCRLAACPHFAALANYLVAL